MSEQQEPTLTSMINSIKDDLISLVNSHIELAQVEAKEAVGRMAKSSGLFFTAIAMANLVVVFVFLAAAYYLNSLGHELWVSFLLVVAGLATLALILGLLAWRQIRKITLGSRTVKSLADTVQTITTLRSGSK